MIKIKLLELDKHRNETTFRPFIMAQNLFKDVGIEFTESNDYDYAFVGQASIIDKKMVLLGNLDAINIFAKGSIEELRSAIIKQARAGKKNGNRFIMCTGSPVTPGTSLTRVREYNKIVRDLRMK